MQIAKFKKYISWNIISALGYFCSIVMIAFLCMYFLASSQLHMRADLDKFFFRNIISNVIFPYFTFYKVQICLVITFLISSIFEEKHYIKNNEEGFLIFENSETYTKAFTIGVILNIVPMYVFTAFMISWIMKFLEIYDII